MNCNTQCVGEQSYLWKYKGENLHFVVCWLRRKIININHVQKLTWKSNPVDMSDLFFLACARWYIFTRARVFLRQRKWYFFFFCHVSFYPTKPYQQFSTFLYTWPKILNQFFMRPIRNNVQSLFHGATVTPPPSLTFFECRDLK